MCPVVVEATAGVDHAAELLIRGAGQLLGPPDQAFQLVLDRIVELETVAIEDLEPIVEGRVVRGRDHDPGREWPLPGHERKGGRRDDADDVGVDAHAGRAGRDSRHEHVTRTAGVLPDNDRATAADEPMRDGAPQGVRQGRFQVDIRDTADPVGAEQACHGRISLPATRPARRRC
jgi:hypothetical protein